MGVLSDGPCVPLRYSALIVQSRRLNVRRYLPLSVTFHWSSGAVVITKPGSATPEELTSTLAFSGRMNGTSNELLSVQALNVPLTSSPSHVQM